MMREGYPIARCTVERMMREMGLAGVIRGKPVRTTISDKAAPCPLDHVNRQFHAPAPNRLWVSDFTYVATWAGFVYVAFNRHLCPEDRRLRASRTTHASFVLEGLEQALHDRRPVHRGGLVHHSDRGSQYVSIKYTERLAEAGIEPSVGSVGDTYDNALAETINGRGDPSARTLAILRGRGIRDTRMGRLVQQSAPAGAHRQHPACLSRTAIL